MQINKKIIATTVSAIALATSVAIPALAADVNANAGVRAQINMDRGAMRTDIRGQVRDMYTANQSMRASTTAEIKALQANRKAQVEAIRNNIKNMRDGSSTPAMRAEIKDMRGNIKDIRASTTEEIKAQRDTIQLKLEANRKAVKASTQAEIANFKGGVKVKLDALKKADVTKVLTNAFTKLNDALGRIGAFDKKLSDAITARKAKGLDTTAAESALVIARQSLDEAKVDVSAISDGTNASVNATTTSTNGISKDALKLSVSKAVEAIKNARSKYEDVIKALPKTEGDASASTTRQ